MCINIRQMTIDDYDDAIALWKNAGGIVLRPADSRHAIHAYLQRNPGLSFVALHGKLLIGTVMCGHDGRRGYLQDLAVHPDFRRTGIGRILTEKALNALKAVGIFKCHLFALRENEEAIEFWRDTGWFERKDIKMLSILIPREKGT